MRKSFEIATGWKEKGNRLYMRGAIRDSRDLYTKAILSAPWPNEAICLLSDNLQHSPCPSTFDTDEAKHLLALCFGNRSAASFEDHEFQDALLDIEQALCLGCPMIVTLKLFKRKIMCLMKLKKYADATKALKKFETMLNEDTPLPEREKWDLSSVKEQLNKIEIEVKEEYTHSVKYRDWISTSLSLNTSKDQGRHFQAVKSIGFGKCLLKEKPYSSLLNIENIHICCSHCFKSIPTLIPCPWCCCGGYCNEACFKQAWISYHWLECKIIEQWTEMDWTAKLAVRMILTASTTDLLCMLEETQKANITEAIKLLSKSECEPYYSVLQLSHSERYIDGMPLSKVAATVAKYIWPVLASHFKLNYAHYKETFANLLQYHMLQIQINAHAVSCNLARDKSGCANIEVVKWNIGKAIYIKASLFNHSCDPNIFLRYTGNIVTVIASAEVHEGDTLFHCYGPQIGKMSKEDRQNVLMDEYFFHCHCIACNSSTDGSMIHREYGWNGLKCQHCEGLLPVTSSMSSTCTNCLVTTQIGDIVKEKEKLLKNAGNIMENSTAENIENLLEYEHKLSLILYKYNMELNRIRDIIAFMFSRRDVQTAIKYCKQSCEAVNEVFGSYSIEVAEELPKLAQLLFCSGDIDSAKSVAVRAIKLLKVYYGDEHSDVKNLLQILDN